MAEKHCGSRLVCSKLCVASAVVRPGVREFLAVVCPELCEILAVVCPELCEVCELRE